jgi:GT2 family glycosyltransferase
MPLISIIIPYAGAHKEVVKQAVASCLWQSFQDIEVIVINDSKSPNHQFVDERVHVITTDNTSHGTNRAAIARNAGVARARGEFVVFLDADDYLLPKALEVLLRGHVTHDKTYTYSSHFNGHHHMRPPEYVQEKYRDFNIHPITCLIPTNAVRAVGGFDEYAPGWEDWTLFLRLAIAGYCGHFVRGAIFVYRDELSVNHIIDTRGGRELMDRVLKPYKKDGRIDMGCCGSDAKKITTRRVVASMPEISYQEVGSGMTVLEYYGDMRGTATWRHPVSGRIYRAGRNSAASSLIVPNEDVEWLLQFKFRRVMPSQELVPPPEPALVVIESEPDPETSTLMQTLEAAPYTFAQDVESSVQDGGGKRGRRRS